MPLQYPVLYKSMDAKGDAIVQAAINSAITDAESLWTPEKFDGVFPTKGFGIRKLEKWDVCPLSTTVGGAVASNTWLVSITTARTWECVFSQTISQDCYVILTGVFNYDGAPDLTTIQIVAEGIDYLPFDMQETFGWDVATAYLSHPIVVRPQKRLLVWARAETAGRKQFGFIGYTLGKRGYLINRVGGV